MSSCCGGNCGCGAGCKCGSSCNGCKMYADLSYSEAAATNQPMIVGVAPQKAFSEGSEMGAVAAEADCPCGDKCTCNPCNCPKK